MRAPRLTLNQRLFMLTAAAMLPALAIIGFNEISLRQSRASEIHAYAGRMSELAALEMERVVTGAATMMIAVGTSPSIQSSDVAGCASYLDRLQSALPQLGAVVITDANGAAVCSSDPASEQGLAREVASLVQRLETAQVSIGHYVETDAGTGLLLGTRVPGVSGSGNGYVLATVSLEYLGRLLLERSFAPGSAMTVADRNGVILAREPFPQEFVGTTIPPPYIGLVTADQPGTIEIVSQDGTQRVLGYQPANGGLGLYVSAGVSTEEFYAPINQAFLQGLALALTGAALAFWLAWLFGRTFIQRPVAHILQTIERWRVGDGSARTGMTGGAAEFHRIGVAIDQMLDEISQRQQLQEKAEAHRDLLARELGHRIKNLLTTVQAVARQTFRSELPEEQKLQALEGRLKVMGNAQGLLTGAHETSATVHDIVRTAIEPFDPPDRTRFDVSGGELELTAAATLSLAMALHELCTNAAKYGALANETGTVRINWTAPERDEFTLTWAESGGPPVTPPEHQGFGSKMVQMALASDLGAEVQFDYAPNGLVCRVTASAKKALTSGSSEHALNPGA